MKNGKMTKREYLDYLADIVSNNAGVLERVQTHGQKTRSKMYFWVCVGAIAGYFIETQINNLDNRLKKLEAEENIVNFKEFDEED